MEIYQSKDFYLSAYLIAEGFQLYDHERSHGFTLFYFIETDQLKALVKQFYSLNASVEPIKYSQALRALKGVIHSLSASTSNQGQLNNGFINKQKAEK